LNLLCALAARDKKGKSYTVRYEAVNAVLLNEFLEEHHKVEEQTRKVESLEKAVIRQEKENEAMRAMLKEQATQIQKVNAQIGLMQSVPQIVSTRP